MDLARAYGILVFYGILAIITAAIGHWFDKKSGFSNGYIVGVIISVVLWFVYGKKASGM
jgi:Na+/melibiose symporter-like transporter